MLLNQVVYCAGNKPTIAIMDLQCQGLSATETVLLTDRLLSEIGKIGTYDIVERAKRDEILKEQGFTQSGSCDEASCLVEVGKYLSAQKMIGGSIGKFGEVWVINLRLVDVSSGRVEKMVDKDFAGEQIGLLLLMKDAAGELVGKDMLLPEEKALLEKDRKARENLENEAQKKRAVWQTEEEQIKADVEAKRQQEAKYQAQLLAIADKAARKERLKALEKQIALEQKKREKELKAKLKREEKLRKQRLNELNIDKPFYKKWWFWGCVGVVGAGTVYLINNSGATSDDTSPVDDDIPSPPTYP